MKNSSWQVLRSGDQGVLTLAVDFTSTGRTQACFRDLVPMLDVPGEIWETVAPSARKAESMSGDDYVERWVAGVRGSGRTVTTVLGYCVGAVFAAPLARRLAELQPVAPRLVVLDPELPNTVGLYRDFHHAADALTMILSPDELARFHADGQEVQQRYGFQDISLIGPALAAIFRTAISTAGERLGLDEDIRDELGGTFASFVGYLRAAQQIDPKAVWATAAAITSSQSTQRDLEFAEDIRLDVDHEQMLRHADVARAVSGLMAAGSGTDVPLAG